MNRPGPGRPNPLVWVLAFFAWAGFALVAVAGGIFRVMWLAPRLGEYPANVAETLALVLVLAGMIWIVVPWLNPLGGSRGAARLGLFWFSLTIAFEFLFGHFVDGASWSALLANYDIAAGRLWILVPLTMGLGPLLVDRLRRYEAGSTSVPVDRTL